MNDLIEEAAVGLTDLPSAPAAKRDPSPYSKSEPRWIWCADAPCDKHVWAWARRRFPCPPEGRASLEITADLRYDLWVNGTHVGFGPPRSHSATPTVDTYDLSPYLRQETNVLAIRVYSLGKADISSCMPQRGGLWCRLRAGEHEIVSDRKWTMRQDPAYAEASARRGSAQPPSECYDARKSLGNIQAADFDDGDWPLARELEALPSFAAFETRDIPFFASKVHGPDRVLQTGRLRVSRPYPEIPLSEIAWELREADDFPPSGNATAPDEAGETPVHCPATLHGSRESSYVLWDLGRLWVGYPVVTLEGPAGTIVDLCYGEHLHDGRVDPTKARLNYFDRVILGVGALAYKVTWPKCARYVQAVVHGGEARASLAWQRNGFPVARRGSFASSSPVLDHAVELSLHTVELCMEDSYLDTPWRERGAWLGDDLIKAQACYAYFGDYSLARRFLLHHARGQMPTGQMRGKYPGNITSYVSTWTLTYPPSLLEYSIESGDWGLARQVWKNLVTLVDWILSMRTEAGVLEAPPATVDAHTNRYNFIDWAPVDMRGANAAWNAFGYHALTCAARIAVKIGQIGEAETWTRAAQQLRERFRICFWDEEKGVFVNGLVEGKKTARWGCHENTLALLYDLATEEQRSRIFDRLNQENLQNIFLPDERDYDAEMPGYGKIPTVSLALSRYRWPDDKMVPLGTPYFAMYWLEVLCQSGLVAEAQRFIETRWGDFARQGATSVWETWDMRQSLSHAWSCSPAPLAARHFAGVHRLDDSGKRYAVLPSPGLLTRVRSRVATRFGVLQVAWEKDRLVVDVPPGLEVEAGLPSDGSKPLFVNGAQAPTPRESIQASVLYRTATLQPGRSALTL